MTNKRLIFFLLFLLVLPMAFSAKVTQTFVGGADGLEIRVPQGEFLEQNIDVQLNLHVFNKSDGLLMDNTTTECLVHIFNKSGFHIFDEHLDFDEGEDHHGSRDFTLNISGSNFTQLGFHSFIIQCNTSRFGGFVSGSFRVTETGEDDSPNNIYPVIIGIIAIITFFSVLGYSQRKKLGLMIICFAIALIEIVNLTFMLYLHESAKSIISMLRINFWITFLIVIGIAFIALIFVFMKALNLNDSMEDDDKKWRDR